ncbi:MAG: prepilin-type N-terminal cleavage/methylation domain-containing protein [Candidatus Babeliaceae bacterium]|nr:prepilin-type N-terminal cleavage/methylation domain-containing protein [Candidatus Babeliaceae bacterium]
MKLVKHGFSLIEVLISLVMVSITITSLLTLQSTLQTMLFKDNWQWKAEQLALQAFVEAEKRQQDQWGKTIEREQDDFKIIYSLSKPQEGSSLAEIENLVTEKVIVTWQKVFSAQSFTLIKYSYHPKPPEKEKKSQEDNQKKEISEQKTGETAAERSQIDSIRPTKNSKDLSESKSGVKS